MGEKEFSSVSVCRKRALLWLPISINLLSMSKPTDLVQGTLDLLVLKILAVQPMHGWAIGERMKQMSKDVLQVGAGSLYPALHKLEQAGLIEAEWSVSESNRRVKFYSVTKGGRKRLQQEAADWKRLSGAISSIVFET
jgi:PadR family transcriptional regulator PadR